MPNMYSILLLSRVKFFYILYKNLEYEIITIMLLVNNNTFIFASVMYIRILSNYYEFCDVYTPVKVTWAIAGHDHYTKLFMPCLLQQKHHQNKYLCYF